MTNWRKEIGGSASSKDRHGRESSLVGCILVRKVDDLKIVRNAAILQRDFHFLVGSANSERDPRCGHGCNCVGRLGFEPNLFVTGIGSNLR